MTEPESGAPSGENSEFKLKESSSLFPEDASKWLAALETYVTVTQTTCLEIKAERIGIKEAATIYKFLANSQVTDLNLCCNNLKGGIEDLIQLLLTSEIKRLHFCRCVFSNKELLRLLEVLKDTRVTELIMIPNNKCRSYDSNFGLDIIDLFKFDPNEKDEFISHLLDSRLVRLDFQLRLLLCSDFSPVLCFVENTAITNIDLSYANFSEGILISLLERLPYIAITDLNLSNIVISEKDLELLSFNLRDSNLLNLNLSHGNINDAGLDALAVGLVHSKVCSLDVSNNSITGSSSFGLCLKDTSISDLNLSYNEITNQKLLSFPDFLRHSSVVKLNMARCQLGDELGPEFIKCIKFSKVTDLNVSLNSLRFLSAAELVATLEHTDLKNIDFSFNGFPFEAGALLSTLMEKIKGSSVESLDWTFNKFQACDVKSVEASFIGTTLTHLNLRATNIGSSLTSLIEQLKSTAVTHLRLDSNMLSDAGAKTLANSLADTKIIDLNLCCNLITDCGAKFLASCLKRTKLVHLDLSINKIKNKGFKILAKHAEGTFLVILDVSSNPGNRHLLIDRVLLENQTAMHRFLNFFKLIAPESNTNTFRFDNINDKSVDDFLEECLRFYKTASEQSSAVNVLVAEEGSSFSMEQIVNLLEDFPQQFSVFVANKIEASPTEHVDFLKRAEELKVTKIVEFLLLNRSALMIDQSKNILHPYVYKLLHKYKMPLFNLSLEPERKTQLIEYFTKHSDLEGAVDILSMLNQMQS